MSFSGRWPRWAASIAIRPFSSASSTSTFCSVGDLLEDEEQLQFAGRFVRGAGAELFDVGLDLLARHAAHHQVDRPAVDDAIGLLSRKLGRQLDLRVLQQVLVDLLAHRLLHVVVDPLDHLLAEGVAQFCFVVEAQVFEELLR